MNAFQFHAFALSLIYAPWVFGFYSAIAICRKISIHDIDSWKQASIMSNISIDEFILRAQSLCRQKGYFLMEIVSAKESTKLVIKEYPSLFWWFGQFYCIEFRMAEQPNVVVYARGGVFKKSTNASSFNNVLNAFVKFGTETVN